VNSKSLSVLVWCVVAIALAAIVWRFAAPTQSSTAAIGTDAPTIPRTETAIDLEEPALAALPVAATSPALESNASTTASAVEERSDEQPASLYGFVRPPAGRDVIGPETGVSLIDQHGVRQLTTAAADGAYAFAGLAPGRYWLRAGSQRGGEARAMIDVVGDVRRDVQLVLPPEVRVKVVDAQGEPVKEMLLLAVATADAPDRWIDEVRGSFNNPFGVGAFWQNGFGGPEMPAAYLGRVVLKVEPPVYLSLVRYQYVVATQRVERGQDEVTFVVDPDDRAMQFGSLRFRVVDANTGERIDKASGFLDGAATQTVGAHEEVNRVQSLAPGNYALRVMSKGYACPRVRVRVEPGMETDVGDVALEPETWIAGRVIDEKGAGVETTMVYAGCDTDGRPFRPLGNVFGLKSGSDGAFRVSKLARGRFELGISEEPYGAWRRIVDTRGGPVEDLVIHLARAVPLVVRASSEDWDKVRFRVIDAEGSDVYASKLWQAEPNPIPLAPGRYVVEVRATPDAEPRRIPITIVDVPVDLELP